MRKETKEYYVANDGARFDSEKECAEYEHELQCYRERIERRDKLLATLQEVETDIAKIEYRRLIKRGVRIRPVIGHHGCSREGYYNECPYCGEMTGNYEGRNLTLRVDKNVYKCVKCGKFFTYG